MAFARVSRRGRRAVPRAAGPGPGSSFLLPGLGLGLGEAGREYGDLGFPGDGRLGRGGVGEFRPCFLRPFGVPLTAGQVEGVQAGAGGVAGRGGKCFQR